MKYSKNDSELNMIYAVLVTVNSSSHPESVVFGVNFFRLLRPFLQNRCTALLQTP